MWYGCFFFAAKIRFRSLQMQGVTCEVRVRPLGRLSKRSDELTLGNVDLRLRSQLCAGGGWTSL